MPLGIKNADLELIFSGREFAQADVEAEWCGTQTAARFWHHRNRARVQSFLLIPI